MLLPVQSRSTAVCIYGALSLGIDNGLLNPHHYTWQVKIWSVLNGIDNLYKPTIKK